VHVHDKSCCTGNDKDHMAWRTTGYIHCCTGNLKGHTICLVQDGRSAVGQLEYMCPAEILH